MIRKLNRIERKIFPWTKTEKLHEHPYKTKETFVFFFIAKINKKVKKY